MTHLSLRLRVFLFFCLLMGGCIAAVLLGIWLGVRQQEGLLQLADFAPVMIVSIFGIAGVTVAVWLLFDENVSKPIEVLAAKLRVRIHGNVQSEIDADVARYLGDLAPAAHAFHQTLKDARRVTDDAIARTTNRLENEKKQLLRLLSDLPVAVILLSRDHKIVLYDGQAAELLSQEAPLRLKAPISEYFDQGTIADAISALRQDERKRKPIAVTGQSGTTYKGFIRLFGAQDGYSLTLETGATEGVRPPTYDFDLLQEGTQNPDARPLLADLSFTVFDCETTGLDPEKDKVVQFAAVRIVKGKIVSGETIDSLVNPQRPIPESATRIHGIDDAMVAEAPQFDLIARSFHRFTRDSIIVAHNAPFDMRFLKRACAETNLRFDNPVLDTVHLSAYIFGGSAPHTLDALCDRLDILISEDQRHSAMGDTLATAQAFIEMLNVAQARGIRTLDELRAEIRKHRRILKIEGEET